MSSKTILRLSIFLSFGLSVVPTSRLFSQTIGPEKGALVIVGGGKLSPEIYDTFIELAGGKEKASIIVIPTAGEDSSIKNNPSADEERFKKLGVKSVTVLHTRDPKVANTDAFIAPIKKATAVWFVGGRQWRLADCYLNTKAHTEFKALLNRGGVIGGTSAGATIQGSYLFRGDTKGNTMLVGDHIKGLDFIHNVAIDQHILRRNRQFDLLGFIKQNPKLLGIGIDENTAIVVKQNNFKVIGNSYVAIYDAAQIAGKTEKPSAGQYVTDGPFYFLGKGQEFDLKGRKVIAPPAPAKTGDY